jgi:galactose oxidase
MWFQVFLLTLSTISTSLGIGIVVDSFEDTNPPTNAVDGDATTFWHSEYSPVLHNLPHTIYLDLGSQESLSGFTYNPRQDTSFNGNIGSYTLGLSTDNSTWKTVSSSSFEDTKALKTVVFPTTTGRYFKLVALTEAGNRGNWSSASEFGVIAAVNAATLGQWGPLIELPLVPAGAFLEIGTGVINTFAAYRANQYSPSTSGWTITASYNPTTGVVSEANISNTKHDMFCPGMSLDFNGRCIVTGGDSADATSIFTSSSNSWVAGPGMKIPRGYAATATVSDGRIFNIGGSWNGGQGGKNGEIYDPVANTWTLLPGCPVQPMLTADQDGPCKNMFHLTVTPKY